MSLALVTVMVQCKKNVETVPNDVNNMVDIILDVNNNGTRVDVNTVTGAVVFENGDVIYVASDGKYVGTLTHNGSHFAGTLTNPTVGIPLHFYFLGNIKPGVALTPGSSTSCSVFITDQVSKLPVISYATSKEDYSSEVSVYSAHLKNQCALVKFNVNTPSGALVCITGFNNKVTVDFSSAIITQSKSGEGVINLGTGSGERWAILLEQDALSDGEAFTTDGGYVGTCGEVPAISKNDFLKDGIEVNVLTDNDGKLRGKFSVGSSEQVYFSKGNLQYIGSASTPYWKFAEEQYERLGDNGQGSTNTKADRDLFGRGTSGYNGMHPYLTYDNNSYYCDKDFEGVNINYDWGVYNAIRNGGNTAGLWRTPKGEEFDYLFKDRSGYRFTQVYIDDVFGLMLFPDGWDASIYSFAEVNNLNTRLSTPITSAEWKNQLEPNGAVFLPA
ncbi:MAG: hypothetical protein J6T37_01125, partial [Bacteroidales bacterium]|nr:hypothetical protein [Bacteroidales bacterium]